MSKASVCRQNNRPDIDALPAALMVGLLVGLSGGLLIGCSSVPIPLTVLEVSVADPDVRAAFCCSHSWHDQHGACHHNAAVMSPHPV